eukprot:CAMPEP_0197664700 /NCGR_PEP_ID=MMETSP1338-20131121/58797_1 /TAXON_ID=43686 ORGANISM="Pelagodinium beii, Strain RCC1491" /NCGR_SAMPLE_ID=MMETSP1338 /ASSEMBLY_ACC=CAM_ASM_000754 /LENGTH=441 /DNA_ID=CAMNT_0043243395 /DNA_START=35 /DNA_END=1360 /DNA_ORIENTATION=+
MAARTAWVFASILAVVAGNDGSSGAPAELLAHPLSLDAEPPLLGEQPQQPPQPQQAQQPEQREQPEEKEKDWQKFVPGGFVKYVKREDASSTNSSKAQSKELIAQPLSLSENRDSRENQDSRYDYQAQSQLVSTATQREAEAEERAREALENLRQARAESIEGQAANWKSPEDFSSQFRDHSTDSWEKSLEWRIQQLEKFNAEPRKSVLDFNATKAVELIYQVNAASAEVQRLTEQQESAAKNAFKKAKYAAMQKVKSMEYDARSSAKKWKEFGKETVRAQRAAGMSENVYERHSDVMSDAAGDVSNRAENYAERLEDKVRDHFGDMEDRLLDGAADERARQLQNRAKEAVHRLHEVADRIGAEAAFQEAESSARFRAEERRWEAAHGPKAVSLLSAPVDGRSPLHLVILAACSLTLVAMVAFRQRPMTQPLDIEAPPLLG